MDIPTATIDKFLTDLVSFLDSSEIGDDWLIAMLLKYEAARRSPRHRRHRAIQAGLQNLPRLRP